MIGALVVRDASLIVLWERYRFFAGIRSFLEGCILILIRISALTVECVIGPKYVQSMPFINLPRCGPEKFGQS
jgi:hypothetical protein